MKELWIDGGTLRKEIGWSEKTVCRKRKSGELRVRRAGKSGNGKPIFEYSSLSPALAEYQLKLASLAMTSPVEEALVPAQVAAQRELSRPNVRHLTGEQQEELVRITKLIAPMVAFTQGRRIEISLGDGREPHTLTEIAQHIALNNPPLRRTKRGTQHLSFRTVWNFWTAFKNGNLDDLLRKTRNDKGASRSFEDRPELQKFVLAKWKESCNYSHIADIVKREWGGPLLPYGKEEDCPSRAAIFLFISEQLPKSVQDCVRLPKQKWEAKHAPHLVTGRGEYTRPNQVWVGDHRLYDVLLRNDCFPFAPKDAALRLWHTAIEDLRTRVIVGSVWSVDPSWRSIAGALKQGIARFGIPELFYADNGKDFRKVGAGARRGSLLVHPQKLDGHGRVTLDTAPPRIPGLLARLGVAVCYCIPRHPQSKQIESFFNFVSRRFDPLFFGSGYTGRRPDQRSDFCREMEKQHKEFLAGRRRESPLPGAKFFIQLHAQWLQEYNATHSHSGRGMNGRAPMAVMDELLPVSERKIPDMAELEPLFWDVRECKVTNCKVQVNNATYSAVQDPQDQQSMYLANGETVAVHCDPNDMASALAFENVPNGKLLARLVSDELAAQKPITHDEVKAMIRQRARLRKASNQAVAILTNGVPSEIDLLAQRGQLLEQQATGTEGGRAIERYRGPQSHSLQPAFVSDAVARDADFWRASPVVDSED